MATIRPETHLALFLKADTPPALPKTCKQAVIQRSPTSLVPPVRVAGGMVPAVPWTQMFDGLFLLHKEGGVSIIINCIIFIFRPSIGSSRCWAKKVIESPTLREVMKRPCSHHSGDSSRDQVPVRPPLASIVGMGSPAFGLSATPKSQEQT
jgi:hypothetical protein